MNKEKMIAALNQLSEAHSEICRLWDDCKLNELEANKQYPYTASFDELYVCDWAEAVIEELQSGIKHEILDTNYLNTGGNCMVSVFEVWFPTKNQTLFLSVNEECGILNTVDTFNNELDIDNYEEIQVEMMYWEDPKKDSEYWPLFEKCKWEFIKADCKQWTTTVHVAYEDLSPALKLQVGPNYLAWLKDTELLVETDGVLIKVNPLLLQK